MDCRQVGHGTWLPIAPFRILDVPEELIEADGGLELSELGVGPAFGSQRMEVMELTSATVPEISYSLQQDVLAFDWWIRNGDRLLTERGGNPDLFWEPASRSLVVLDHNQAFDLDFDPGNFIERHVFAGQRQPVFGDMLRHHEYTARFSSVLNGWIEIRAAIPEAWLFADPEMTVPADFDLDRTYQLLKRHERDDFWKTS